MSASALDSAIYGPLLADPELRELFSDQAQVEAMLTVEAALARVQGRLGIIPADAAATIEAACRDLEPDLVKLGLGTLESGIPMVALLGQLRAGLDERSAGFVHRGATSQDIVDSALILSLRRALRILETTLTTLIRHLATLADRHRDTLMVARTRGQQALPTRFGLKVAGWTLPLIRHRQRLRELLPRLLVLQFGGAAGTLAALGDRGLEVARKLAEELHLGEPLAPWHNQRDNLAELAGWLSLVTGSLGKLGQDLALMSQTEVGEVRESDEPGHGGSSAMPHKSNPVISETLITAARFNATQVAALHQAQIQEHERGGAGWMLEWLTLPPMVVCTGAALRNAERLIARLRIDPRRMLENLQSSRGLVLAEAATLTLTEIMPMHQARAAVQRACQASRDHGRDMLTILQESTEAPIDWQRLADPRAYLGTSGCMIDRVVRAATESPG